MTELDKVSELIEEGYLTICRGIHRLNKLGLHETAFLELSTIIAILQDDKLEQIKTYNISGWE